MPSWTLTPKTLGKRESDSVFNIEVFNICQMPFWLSKRFFLFLFLFRGGALHKNVPYKVFTCHSEDLSKDCMSQNTMSVINK